MASKKARTAEIARRMDMLWRTGEQPTRGPKPGLTIDRMARRAVEIADKHGVGAVTMERVAKRLGVTTMALYRYVRRKSELLDLMVEAAMGPPPALANAAGWRAKLALWARSNLALYERHPWLLNAAIAEPPFGPSQLAWFDAALDAVAEARLSPAESIAVVSLVDDHARGSAQLLVAIAARPDFPEWYGNAMARASADGRYPRIAALVAGGVLADPEGDIGDRFAFGLDRILDGVERYLHTGRRHY